MRKEGDCQECPTIAMLKFRERKGPDFTRISGRECILRIREKKKRVGRYFQAVGDNITAQEKKKKKEKKGTEQPRTAQGEYLWRKEGDSLVTEFEKRKKKKELNRDTQ